MKKHYHPNNMVVVGAGRINSKQLVGLTEKMMGDLPKKKPSSFQKECVNQTKPHTNFLKKASEQVQIGLGFPAYSYGHKDIYVLGVLNNILGGMMSSRLFIEIRVKRGLAYFINSGLNVYQDTGNLMIQAGLDKSRINEAIKAILQELTKMKKEEVTAEELKKAKDNIKGKMILKIEDSENVASLLGKQYLLTNKIVTPQQYLKKIAAVRSKDIKRVAKDIFVTQKLNLVLIGPFNKTKELIKTLRLN
ncbi:insulinase family protein [bacterium]|nr:insulinase family protein [bacterium]